MPLPLTYDTLPPLSRLRREWKDGTLTITAAAEEPGPLVRRAALLRSALPAAMICFVLLVIGIAILGSTYRTSRRTMPQGLSVALLIAFIVFCGSLFAFVWRVQFSRRIEMAQHSLRQSTIIAASKGRLLIESTGPLGASSHEIDSPRNLRVGTDCLEIESADQTIIRVLHGRDDGELNWVARSLQIALSE